MFTAFELYLVLPSPPLFIYNELPCVPVVCIPMLGITVLQKHMGLSNITLTDIHSYAFRFLSFSSYHLTDLDLHQASSKQAVMEHKAPLAII